jgi:hypothetical protein
VNADPHDPAPRLGKARLVVQGREIARGIELLAALIIEAPELWEARVSLGKLLAGAGSREEFLDWHSRLPAELDQNPDVWSIRGRFAEQQGEADVAIRC